MAVDATYIPPIKESLCLFTKIENLSLKIGPCCDLDATGTAGHYARPLTLEEVRGRVLWFQLGLCFCLYRQDSLSHGISLVPKAMRHFFQGCFVIHHDPFGVAANASELARTSLVQSSRLFLSEKKSSALQNGLNNAFANVSFLQFACLVVQLQI
jgi:hypothetical protein